MFGSVKLMLGGVVALIALAGPAQGGIIVVAPNAQETVEGNGGNAFPFGVANLPTQRYQQVYAASQFAAFGWPVFITQIAFRPNAGFGPFSYTIPDIQLNLSTIGAAPDGLSTAFAANVGPDDAVVHSGPLLLSSAAAGPPGGPLAFDITIPLQNPFLYDPAAGNLLLDVRRFAAPPVFSAFDSHLDNGDSISRVFTNVNVPGGVDSPVGIADSRGLVTRFTAVAVPEPATLTLFGLGSVALLGWGWRRKQPTGSAEVAAESQVRRRERPCSGTRALWERVPAHSLTPSWSEAMRRVLPALTLALAAVATPPAARAGLIVAPNANATVEGNSFTAAPLNFPARTFQWILSASEFAVVPPGSQITAIGLRIDASQPAQPPSDMFFSRWDLQLSSALNGIGALSATFADNIGPDAVLVRAGPLTVPAGSLPGGSSPNPFVPIAFATPYTYTGGDLLLTLRHSGRAGTFSVRSDGNTVNATGRAIFGDGADATTAFSLNANYPITQFQIQAVPEPSTLVLTGLGGICSVGVWWRRRAAAPGTSAGGDVERQS